MQNGRSSLTSLIPDSAQEASPYSLTGTTILTANSLRSVYGLNTALGAFTTTLPAPSSCPGAKVKFIYGLIGGNATITAGANLISGSVLVNAAAVPIVLGTNAGIRFTNSANSAGTFAEFTSNGAVWTVFGASGSAGGIVAT